MNDLAELPLVHIMLFLVRANEIASRLQCSQRMTRVAKKHGIYGYMVRGGVAANRIARAYRFYCKFGGKTFRDTKFLWPQLLATPPPLVAQSGLVGLTATISNWPELSRAWLNRQYHNNFHVYSSLNTSEFYKFINLPRHFDFLRTLIISCSTVVQAAELSIAYRRARVQYNGSKTRCFSWEVNVPFSTFLLFDSLQLLLRFDSPPNFLRVEMRGIFFGSDRDLLSQSLVTDMFGATRKATNL